MGNRTSEIRDKFLELYDNLLHRKKAEIVILGLDAAGKSTLVNFLNRVTSETIPTIGFNLEKVVIGKTTITVSDIGGQTTFRNFWKKFLPSAQGLVFVIDVSDLERFEQAANAFKEIAVDLNSNIPVLIFLNKIDKVSDSELEERRSRILELFKFRKDCNSASSMLALNIGGNQKEFGVNLAPISILNNINKMENDPNYVHKKSEIHQGFFWLLENIKTK